MKTSNQKELESIIDRLEVVIIKDKEKSPFMVGFTNAIKGRIQKVIKDETEPPTPPKGYKSPTEKYPELDAIAAKIEQTTVHLINLHAPAAISDMPYARQCVLEMVIKRLEACV